MKQTHSPSKLASGFHFYIYTHTEESYWKKARAHFKYIKKKKKCQKVSFCFDFSISKSLREIEIAIRLCFFLCKLKLLWRFRAQLHMFLRPTNLTLTSLVSFSFFIYLLFFGLNRLKWSVRLLERKYVFVTKVLFGWQENAGKWRIKKIMILAFVSFFNI